LKDLDKFGIELAGIRGWSVVRQLPLGRNVLLEARLRCNQRNGLVVGVTLEVVAEPAVGVVPHDGRGRGAITLITR
jgi:hypothetical protein